MLRICKTDLPQDVVFSGFVDLTEAVFEAKPLPPWPVWTMVDASSCCIAGLQCRLLRLASGGEIFEVAALRNVAVAADWRGLGLMRDLMSAVLEWCDERVATTLLYAETPGIYGRFGFVPHPQHAFEGEAPAPEGAPTAHSLDLSLDDDLLGRLLTTRAPLSSRCSLIDDGGLTAAALAGGAWPLFYDPSLDALFVREIEDDVLVLVDIVASRIPTAARILGSLGIRPGRLRSLFPPDQLGWIGRTVADDTGLMVRGRLPPAMHEPFMLPPTAGF